jgi:hypothetical protein
VIARAAPIRSLDLIRDLDGAENGEKAPDPQCRARDQDRRIASQNTLYQRCLGRISGYWLAVALVIVLGVALRAPVLAGTLISDDWDHYAMASGVYPVARSPLDLYSVIAARPGERAALLRSGRLPWWSDPGIRISFLRPLGSLSIYADYAWFGADRVPARAHWHSLLWWVLCLVAAAGMLERVLPRAVALAACALFAVDDAHSLPVAWTASRAELIACAFTIAALWAHIAWTQRPSRMLRVLAFGLMCLAMLAGEHALALFAYVAAYALLGARGSVRERVLGFAPLALPVIAYFAVHAVLGYGATGSAFYADPLSDPRRYLAALPARAMLLLGDTCFGYSAEWWFGLPPWWMRVVQTHWLPVHSLLRDDPHVLQLALGSAALVLVLAALVRAARTKDDGVRRLRWLLVGALASLPPLCGTFAMTRLTVAPALGIDACLAWIVVGAFQIACGKRALPARADAALLAAAILLMHGYVAAARSREASGVYAAWSRNEEAWVARAARGDAGFGARHVLVVSANDIATQFSLPFVLHRHHLAMPASSQLLLPPAVSPIEIERLAPNTLELRSTAASGHSGFRNSAYRLEADDFHAGQRFATPSFEVEVVSVTAGTPTDLRFIFAKSLDDPSYLFLYPRAEGLTQLQLPALGGTLELGPPTSPSFVPRKSDDRM